MEPSWTDVYGFWVSVWLLVVNALLLLSAVVAGWAAVKALRAAEKSAKAAENANKQVERDSVERTRPYVYVEVLPGLAGAHSFDLRIKNSGRSCAYNLTLVADPWPDLSSRTYLKEQERKSDTENMPMIRTLFDTPRSLPPGCSIRTVWSVSDEGTLMFMGPEVLVTANYSSQDGTQYTDQYQTSTHNAGLWPIPAGGPLPSAEPTGRQYYNLGRTIARAIGEISR